MPLFTQQDSPSFSHSSRAGFQENKRKHVRPLEAQAQNWHWRFYHTLLANVSHKAIPDSRRWEKLPCDIPMGHAQTGVEQCGHICNLPQTGSSITATLHMIKWRLKEVKMPCPSYAASKWKRQDSNSGVRIMTFKPMLLG